jgi:tetratricopeptide (TPR) repeat protein
MLMIAKERLLVKVKAILILWLMLLVFFISASGQQTAEDWFNKGVALGLQGKYDEAIMAFDKAIEINPQYVAAWAGKSIVLKALGRTTEANAAFARTKELGYTG